MAEENRIALCIRMAAHWMMRITEITKIDSSGAFNETRDPFRVEGSLILPQSGKNYSKQSQLAVKFEAWTYIHDMKLHTLYSSC